MTDLSSKLQTMSVALFSGMLQHLGQAGAVDGYTHIALMAPEGTITACVAIEAAELAYDKKEGRYYRLNEIPEGSGPKRIQSVILLSLDSFRERAKAAEEANQDPEPPAQTPG